MSETLLLLIGGALGWILNGLFGPSVNHFGNSIKEYLQKRGMSEYQAYKLYKQLETIISELHTRNGHNAFHITNPHLNDSRITEILLTCDNKLQKKAVQQWIKHGKINNFAQSDIFFGGMEILKEQLRQEDVRKIYATHSNNNQANVWVFLEEIESYKPNLLDREMLDHLRRKQEMQEREKQNL
jgi:hypothetical protein